MIAAVVLAAGRGTRLGAGVPKGLRPLGDRPLYQYSLDTVAQLTLHEVVLVVPPGHVAECTSAARLPSSARLQVVTGGASRQQSVLAGLQALSSEIEWVGVHDAARPRATPGLWARVLTEAAAHGGAIAAAPVADTLKTESAAMITGTVDRASLWRAQTPQVFRRVELLSALRDMEREGHRVTDEAEAMEICGHPVRIVESDDRNGKISTGEDWAYALYLIERGHF